MKITIEKKKDYMILLDTKTNEYHPYFLHKDGKYDYVGHLHSSFGLNDNLRVAHDQINRARIEYNRALRYKQKLLQKMYHASFKSCIFQIKSNFLYKRNSWKEK